MKKGRITRFKLDPKKPPETDWRPFDAMSAGRASARRAFRPGCPAGDRGSASARSPGAQRACLAQQTEPDAGGVRGPVPLAARHCSGLEQGAHRPDQAARVLLTVIEKDPDAVARAVEA
jgi:hypothetical protein